MLNESYIHCELSELKGTKKVVYNKQCAKNERKKGMTLNKNAYTQAWVLQCKIEGEEFTV